jgi:hypothetical protein
MLTPLSVSSLAELPRFELPRLLEQRVIRLVGQGRLELPTSRLSGVYSNQLSYWPVQLRGAKIKVSRLYVKITT